LFVDADVQSEFILHQLRRGKVLEEVVENLKVHQPSSSTVQEALGMLLDISITGAAPAPVYNQGYIESGNCTGYVGEEQDVPVPVVEPWTVLTSDDALNEHLLTLYFCWEYPIFASLSKQHFLADFGINRPRYCSSLLVNTILAVSCVFSRESEDTIQAGQTVAVTSLQFFSQAERLWAIDKANVSITTVQALGIMSMFEASRGRDNQSMFYSGHLFAWLLVWVWIVTLTNLGCIPLSLRFGAPHSGELSH
jgi:hypothetical protein